VPILTPGRAARRPGGTSKTFIIYHRGGKVVARGWPKRNNPGRQSYQKAAMDRMRAAQRAVKLTPARERAVLEQALQEHLRRNTGVRGTSAVRSRDYLTAALFGRLFSQWLTPSQRSFPASVVQDASDILDNMDPWLGSLLTRTDEGWRPTIQCKPGAVLCCQIGSIAPGICPPARYAPVEKQPTPILD